MNNINRLITWLLTGNIAVLMFLCFGTITYEYFPVIGILNNIFGPFIVAFIIELIAAKICIYFLQREKN